MREGRYVLHPRLAAATSAAGLARGCACFSDCSSASRGIYADAKVFATLFSFIGANWWQLGLTRRPARVPLPARVRRPARLRRVRLLLRHAAPPQRRPPDGRHRAALPHRPDLVRRPLRRPALLPGHVPEAARLRDRERRPRHLDLDRPRPLLPRPRPRGPEGPRAGRQRDRLPGLEPDDQPRVGPAARPQRRLRPLPHRHGHATRTSSASRPRPRSPTAPSSSAAAPDEQPST